MDHNKKKTKKQTNKQKKHPKNYCFKQFLK